MFPLCAQVLSEGQKGRELSTGGSVGRLTRKYSSAPRWPYVLPALVAFLFVGHAYEDGGLRGAALYASAVGLSIIQAACPSILGWLFLFVPFLAYGLIVALSPGSGPAHEWLVFMVLGLGPALVLWFARPWKRRGNGGTQGR